MIDEFSTLKKDFNRKFVKQRYVDDLDLGLFWGWIIENFNPKVSQVDKPVMRQIDIVGGNDIKDILKFIEDLILQNFCSSEEEFKIEYPDDEECKHTITLSA